MISYTDAMRLLRLYVDCAVKYPHCTLADTKHEHPYVSGPVGEMARVYTIAALVGRCPVRVIAVSPGTDTAGRRDKDAPDKRELRSVLDMWCDLYRVESHLRSEIRETRSTTVLDECVAMLPHICRRRERWEQTDDFGRGLKWFCDELEWRLELAHERFEWAL